MYFLWSTWYCLVFKENTTHFISSCWDNSYILWCFWTVVLEKTPESPLDCKEIQPIHSEGAQPWVFFGGNDAEAEAPVLWLPHAKSWLIGKDWCWEGLGAGREGNDRGWDGWMASPTRWTWVWVNSGSWWWTGKPGVLRFMGSQRVRHDWATELTWTEHNILCSILSSLRIQSRHLRMPLMLFWLPVFHLRLFSIDSKGAKNVAHFLFLDFGLCGRIWCFW